MRLFEFSLVLGVLVPIFGLAAAAPKEVIGDLEKTHTAVLKLGMTLGPVFSAAGTEQESIRQIWRNADQSLTEARQSSRLDSSRSAQLTMSAFDAIGVTGALLPFHALASSTERTNLMNEFLRVRGVVLNTYNLLAGYVQPALPVSIWENRQAVWKLFEFRAHFDSAKTACEALNRNPIPGTANWRLPSYDELATNFRAMKDPTRNTAFGVAAGLLEWAWSATPKDEGYEVLHFIDEKDGVKASNELLDFVCVADEVSYGAGGLIPPLTSEEISQKTKDAFIDLMRIGSELPWDALSAQDATTLKTSWFSIVERVEKASESLDAGDPGRAYTILTSGTGTVDYQLSWFGLLMPLYRASDSVTLSQNLVRITGDLEAVTRNIKASTPEKPLWRNYGVSWLKLNQKVGQSQAEVDCGSITIAGTKGWHLPTLAEINEVGYLFFDPTVNPVFGRDIAQWEIWTSDRAQSDATLAMFVSFAKKGSGKAPALLPKNVICRDGAKTQK